MRYDDGISSLIHEVWRVLQDIGSEVNELETARTIVHALHDKGYV